MPHKTPPFTQTLWGSVRSWWTKRQSSQARGSRARGSRSWESGDSGPEAPVIDHLPLMVIRVRFEAGDARITYATSNSQSLFGIPANELIAPLGMAILIEALHPDDRVMLKRAISEVCAGCPVEIQARIVRHDGQNLWVKIQGQPVQAKSQNSQAEDAQGQFHFVDISKEVRALQEELRWMREVVDSAPIGIACLDQVHRRYVNPAFAHLFHLDEPGAIAPDAVSPDEWWKVIHPDDAAIMKRRWEDAAPSGITDEAEFRLRQADGSYRWVMGTAVPRLNAQGHLVGMITSVVDIHDLTEIRGELGEASRRMQVLVDHLPVTVYRKRLTRSERAYLSLSGEFKAQFGLSGTQYRSMSEEGMLLIMKSLDQRPVEQCWDGLVAQGEITHRSHFNQPNGSERWFEFRERLMKRDGDALEVKGIVLDVTDDETQKRQLQAARKRYQDLVELLPVGVFEDHLIDGNIFVNNQWASICGLSPDSFQGGSWTNQIHPDDWERVTQLWDHATQSREPFTAEFRLMRSDGAIVWVLVQALPIFGPYGQFQSYIGTGTDVTRIKDLELELRDTVTHLQATISNLPGVVFRAYHTPHAFKLLYVSEGAERVIGMTAQQALAMTGPQQFALLHPEELEPDFDIAEDLRLTGQSWNRECITRPDGSQYWADVRCSLIESTGDGMIYEGLILDVTAEVSAKQELERQEQERQKLERQMFEAMKLDSLGRLAGGVAHDFNNLLGAILGFAQFVAEDTGPGHPAFEHAERILAAADRGKGLVEQILAFARQSETERRQFSLDALVRESEALLRVAMPKTVHLSVDPSDTGLMIQADRGQLGQVLMNLCMNARDSLVVGDGTIAVCVRELKSDSPVFAHLLNRRFEPALAMKVEEDEQGIVRGAVGAVSFNQPLLVLSVQDSGIGMAASVMRQAFDPFFTTKPQGKGTGLGLSVVHGIVLGHQGAILVESRPGVGTEIQIILPAVIGTAFKQDLPAADEAIPVYGRVLVVDDDRDFGDMICLMLKRQGWAVTYFDDPVKAHAAFVEQPQNWSLLVTDQAMPGLRGQDLIQKIREVACDLPCVLCSGYDEALDEEAANRIGASAWIRKPATAQQFLSVVAKVMKMGSNLG